MLVLSLLVLGFTSLAAQVMLTRELLVTFYGNEFFIGWTLFAWLFWVGVGSVLEKIIKNESGDILFIALCHLATAILLPLELILVRSGRPFLAASPGQIPDLLPVMIVSFFVLAPLCAVFGLQFALVARSWTAGKAYLSEVLGFVLGALAFSYYFAFCNEFMTAVAIMGLNVSAAGLLSFSNKSLLGKKIWAGIYLTVFFWIICCCCSDALNISTASLRLPNEIMLETRNSIYGNIAVTRTGKQVNFYQSGLFSGADNEGQASEMLVHLPLLAHRGPKKVLLVGTGFNGALAEILKHEPREVYYAELDPALGESAASYVSKDLLKALKDARVHLLAGDLRYYWAKLPRDLDAVIINLPNPSTALINRYFTEDFFKKAGECMKSDGIFSTHLSFSPDSVSVPLEELAASVYRSIKSEFPYIVTLPGDTLYFIASRRIFETDPELFIQRMEQRKITNRFATAPFIRDRYTTDRVRMVQEILKSNRSAKSNFDLYPSAYLYNTIYWLSLFHPGAEDWLGGIAKIPFWAWPLLGILALAMSFWRKRPLQEPDIRPGTLMFLGGFSLMSAEVLVIYGFQIFFGNLYYKIAWIMASIMIGMALGTLAGNKTGQVTLKNLANLHIFIAAFFALWLWLLYSDIQARWLSQEIVWFGLSLSIGILVGLEFPWASSLRGADAGKVYAADLFGSCLGALAVSVFLIPAYGFMQVLEILAAMNLLTAILTFYSQTPGTDSPSGQAPSFKPL